MPKIAYLILHKLIYDEDFSIEPNTYGGSPVFARFCKEFDNFHLFGVENNFKFLKPWENKKNCFVISREQVNAIRDGIPIIQVIPSIINYDIICHCHIELCVNKEGTDLIEVPWMPGAGETVAAGHKIILLYNKFQHPVLTNPETEKFYFTLGVKIPEISDIATNKTEYLFFQKKYAFFCGRICWEFCVKELADFCQSQDINCVLAGPIVFQDYYDGFVQRPCVKWLGEISEPLKIQLIKSCHFYHAILDWDAPYNLSIVQALAYGKPIIGTNRGFLTEFLQHGHNGFFVTNPTEFTEAFNKISEIDPRNCYRSVLKYNHLEMIRTVFHAFNLIWGEYGKKI